MIEIKFKSRYEMSHIHKISPNENTDEIIEILNQLTDLGWDFHQWSTTKPDFDTEDIIKAYPEYENASENERENIFHKYYTSLPDYYFIESFGNKEHGYLRADCPTILECAKRNLERANKMLNCIDHEWKYTHSNGHKTCALCRTFQPCTVEEALANYEKGAVKLDEHTSLYFHNKRPLCGCGSHHLIYHEPCMFNDKLYQCKECNKFYPCKYKHLTYISSPVSPIDDNYAEADLEAINDDHLFRHRMLKLGVSSKEMVQRNVVRYIVDMYKHFIYVEKNEDFDGFIEWVEPYVHEYVKRSNVQIKFQENRFNLKDINNLSIKMDEGKIGVLFSLSVEHTDEKQPTPEEIFTDLFNHLVDKIEE